MPVRRITEAHFFASLAWNTASSCRAGPDGRDFGGDAFHAGFDVRVFESLDHGPMHRDARLRRTRGVHRARTR